jgi:hypothetical protein
MAELIGTVIGFMLCIALVLPIPLAIWAVLKSF